MHLVKVLVRLTKEEIRFRNSISLMVCRQVNWLKIFPNIHVECLLAQVMNTYRLFISQVLFVINLTW